MDHERQIQLLVQAERHVAEGVQHIADQERRIADLRREGRDVTKACSLLELFQDTQAKHIAHRNLLLKELER